MLLLLCTAVLSGCTESEDEADDDSSEEDEIYVTGAGNSLPVTQNNAGCHSCTGVQAAQVVVQAMNAPCAPACD